MRDLNNKVSKEKESFTCPLCGYNFKLEDIKCFTECLIKCDCNLIGCPNCHYKFAEESKIVDFVKKLFKRKG